MDTTKIKVGDKVILRSDEVRTVTEVIHTKGAKFPVELYWGRVGYAYTWDGFYWADDEDDLDIIEIISPKAITFED